VIAILVLTPFQPLPTMIAQAADIKPILVASAMKEVLMAVAVLAAATRLRPKLATVDIVPLLLLGLAVVHRAYGGTWMGIKDDLEFVLPFAAGRVIQLSQERRLLWVKLALVSMTVVAMLGLVEYFYVPPTLRALWMGLERIPAQEYAAGYGHYRIGSTLVGPDEFGMMCAFALVMFVAFRDHLPRRWWLAALVLSVGVLLSVMRSAWAAAVLGIAAVEIRRGHRLRAGLVIGAALTVVLLVAEPLGLSNFLAATSSGQEESLRGHEQNLARYSAAVWENPFGTGPGTVGPHASARLSKDISPENSYLALALGYGIVGGILFAVFCALGLWYCYRLSSELGMAALGMLLGYAASMFVLPNHMSFAMGSWAWFPVGMVVTDSVSKVVLPRTATVKRGVNSPS
jgi:O-antigen ligase